MEFFGELMREVSRFIKSKREGIFHVDLRLRPYGNSGPMGCSLETFCEYYGAGGPAHSYERLALVRLRAIAGDPELGAQVERLRDEYIYASASILVEELDRARLATPRPKSLDGESFFELIGLTREFEARWRGGERGAEIESIGEKLTGRLQAGLEENPEAIPLRRALARLHLFRDPPDRAGAAALLEAGLTGDVESGPPPELLNDLAKIEVDQGHLDRAEGHLRLAIEIEESPLRRINLGRLLMASRRFEEASLEFLRAIKIDPARAEHRLARAECVSFFEKSEKMQALERVTGWLAAERISRREADTLEARIRTRRE